MKSDMDEKGISGPEKTTTENKHTWIQILVNVEKLH